MNNKIIKGIIIAVVVGGILAAVFLSMKHVSPSNIKKVESFDFVAYIEQAAGQSISAAAPADAAKAYNNLYAEVQTEAAIQCSTATSLDTTLLTAAQAEDCYQMLFEAYFPKLRSRADNLFAASVWSDSERRFVKEESERLKQMNGTSSRSDSLNNYVNYVNGYDTAMRLLNNARYCRNSTSYNNLRSQAERYCQWPWSNASTIGTSFKTTVGERAKTGWYNSIGQSVRSFDRRDANYYIGSYNSLDNDYTSIYDAIVDYSSTFSNANLSTEKSTLDAAYRRLKNEIEQAQQKQTLF